MDDMRKSIQNDNQWQTVDGCHPDYPMDFRYVRYVHNGEIVGIQIRSFYTPNTPHAARWTSASDQRMDAAARKIVPTARVIDRSSSLMRWADRADGTRAMTAWNCDYMTTAWIAEHV